MKKIYIAAFTDYNSKFTEIFSENSEKRLLKNLSLYLTGGEHIFPSIEEAIKSLSVGEGISYTTQEVK